MAAFVLYAVTLSWGMTATSLPLTAKVAGWDWLPMTNRPLTWLLTLPLHLLPASWIPGGLNLMTAAIAAALRNHLDQQPLPAPRPHGEAWGESRR